jgi:Translation initiation factor 2 (IF-2; GTPase)
VGESNCTSGRNFRLKTDFDSKATGVVLESKIDVGRGPVVTIIVTTGTLKKG